MQWYTTYTAYPAGPDLALVVEQDALMSRWHFSIKSDGVLLFRSAAEWSTPEDAHSAAEQWLATPPEILRWPFDEPIEHALDVRTWQEIPPTEPKGHSST